MIEQIKEWFHFLLKSGYTWQDPDKVFMKWKNNLLYQIRFEPDLNQWRLFVTHEDQRGGFTERENRLAGTPMSFV